MAQESRSLIGRNLPFIFTLGRRTSARLSRVSRGTRRWSRRHEDGLGFIVLGLVLLGIGIGVFVACIQNEDRHIANLATLYNYKIGSTAQCYLEEQQGSWVTCKIISKTPDHRYYTASMIDPYDKRSVVEKLSIENVSE